VKNNTIQLHLTNFIRWLKLPRRFEQLAPILIAASGIFEINPQGTEIRFALSSIAIIFYMLVSPTTSTLRTGAQVGCYLLIARIIIHSYPTMTTGVLWHNLIDQIPGSLYYFLLGATFWALNIQNILDNPSKLAAIVLLADISANIIELLIREGTVGLTLKELQILVGVIAIRDLWVIALFLLVRFKQMISEHNQKKSQLEKTLMLVSGLYGEAIYLKKTIEATENVMSKSYFVYNLLKQINPPEKDSLQKKIETAQLSSLEVAQQVHEIKKDAKRILSGMSKIIDIDAHGQIMRFSDLVALVIKSNEKIIQNQGKNIKFIATIKDDPTTPHVSAVLNILNNLISNSIDAIPKEGFVEIIVARHKDTITLAVIDNGTGIHPQDLQYIFRPGFTTKYNHLGQASTGIGLSHVKAIVEQLHGTIEVSTLDNTCFKVFLPNSILGDNHDEQV